MTDRRHDEIRRRLGRNDPPAPPPDLLAKLKHQIPEHLDFATGRERDTVRGIRASSWRIAASIVLLGGIGWLGLTTLRNAPFAAKNDMAVANVASEEPRRPAAPALPASVAASPATGEVPAVQQKADEMKTAMADAPASRTKLKESRRDQASGFVKPDSVIADASKDADERQALKKVKTPAAAVAESAANPPASPIMAQSAGNERGEPEAANAGVARGALAAPQAPAPTRESAAAAKATDAVSKGPEPPAPLRCASLPYPPEARRAGSEGVALIAATIGPDGRVEKTEIIRSLPHGLGRAAEQAVRNCRFRPAMLDGRPVRTRFEVPVRFDLHKGACVACDDPTTGH